jgi:hypothetical protein
MVSIDRQGAHTQPRHSEGFFLLFHTEQVAQLEGGTVEQRTCDLPDSLTSVSALKTSWEALQQTKEGLEDRVGWRGGVGWGWWVAGRGEYSSR